MAISNPKKTASMKLAVAKVLSGHLNCKEAGEAHGLHFRSISNAVKKERERQQTGGIHPSLMLLARFT